MEVRLTFNLILQKGLYLEDKGILLPWGHSIQEIAHILNLPRGNDPARLEIGNHVVLGGLRMTQMVVGNRGYEGQTFNTFHGCVQPTALDHLFDKFDISLQPSLPESTADGNNEMRSKEGIFEVSYSTWNVRGEGLFENFLTINCLKP